MRTIILFDSSTYSVAVLKSQSHRLLNLSDSAKFKSSIELMSALGVEANKVLELELNSGIVEIWEHVVSSGGSLFQEVCFWEDPVILMRKVRERENNSFLVDSAIVGVRHLYSILNFRGCRPSVLQRNYRRDSI